MMMTHPTYRRHVRLAAAAVVLVSVGLFAATGCERGEGSPDGAGGPAEVPRNVRVLDLEPATLTEFLEISGPVQSVEGADISTEESGTIAEVPNDKGAIVRKNGVLVMLDRRLLEAEMRAAATALDFAEYDEARTRNLYDANQASRQEMLLAETELARVKAVADIASIRYERAAIKAPYDGVVVNRYVEVGQLVGSGTPIARIINPYTLKLAGAVSEREVGYVQVDAPVRVALDGTDAVAKGLVHWVGFEANPTTGKFPVEVYIDNRDLSVRPGVVGRARIQKAEHTDVVAIPRDAIVDGPEGPSVFVVKDDRAHFRPVELGMDQGLMVIATDGLTVGDRIVVRGQRDLTDGALIEIQEKATSSDGSIGSDPSVIRQASTLGAGSDAAREGER